MLETRVGRRIPRHRGTSEERKRKRRRRIHGAEGEDQGDERDADRPQMLYIRRVSDAHKKGAYVRAATLTPDAGH